MMSDTTATLHRTKAENLCNPIQGDADWRQYRCTRLPNGVTVCCIHDKTSKTTAVATTVNVGAAYDPRTISGLAHFCEHMCFLGSSKYPGENEYKSYLAQHGGHSNASTSMHFTTYKFDILADYAEHAIDVFANFFIEPLFTMSGTSREVNAVDSENSKNLTADVRRRLQVLKDIGDPNHCYTKFSTGNSETIPTQSPEQLTFVRDALLAFHSMHYQPKNLTVTIAGPQSLDELQEWIESRFSSMKSRPFPKDPINLTDAEQLVQDAAVNVPPYSYAAPEMPFQSAFNSDVQKRDGLRWPILVTNKPIRSMRKLVLMFPVPSMYKNPDQSPISFLSHLLGHEGPGSSFAVLQNMGWISSLSAGSRVTAPDFNLFQIDISLTIDGEQHWKDVVNVMFQHCQLLSKIADESSSKFRNSVDGCDDNDFVRLWNEKAQLGAMFFHQTSPGDVYGFVPSLCNNIALYGTKHCMSAGCMINESSKTFPFEAIAKVSNMLTPQNCIIERCSEVAWSEAENCFNNSSDGAARKKKEPWYGIDYHLRQIDDSDVLRWEGKVPVLSENTKLFFDAKEKLALPRPNNYIPRSLELCSDLPPEAKLGPRIDKDIEPPNLIVDDKKIGRLWHRLDDRYSLPKSSLTFLIRNAAVENIKDEIGLWQYDSNAAIHSSLLGAMFAEALAQETYDATMAGLQWSLSLSSSGIKLYCSGFSDRLPDLALKILDEFLFVDFMNESYFLSSKDRLVRNLSTYFESRRADAHALYYRDFLLSSVDTGLQQALESVQLVSLTSIRAHHAKLLANNEVLVDCLFSGNVSSVEAKMFFSSASEKLVSAQLTDDSTANMWYPGSLERRLSPGSSTELHFASKNSQEENGAVVVTYQSGIPGYRGPDLSKVESLRSTAAIRLLCHILREPLFDELRTKQTLGYIVSSYYDIGISSATPSMEYNPWTVPVDLIVVSVLSRKLAPPDILERIDDFLIGFRHHLAQLSESDIQTYATALSATLLKPIQKLGIESAMQFSKIQRFAPEIHGTEILMPWDNAKIMAGAILSLDRTEILDAWDRIVHPNTRSRVVSCVYGTTFPLDHLKIPKRSRNTIVVIESCYEILKMRSRLPIFDNSYRSLYRAPFWTKIPHTIANSATSKSVGFAAIIGVGVIATGWTLLHRNKKS